MAKYDWNNLKAKYLAGDYKNLRDFAEQENINYDVLRRKASKWQNEKSQVTRDKITKIVTKTVERIATKEAKRNARISTLADKLADKLEQAIEQIDQYIVTNKVKTKTIEYNYDLAKPKREVSTEEEVKQIVAGIIDKRGLKFLTAALKDINDIQVITLTRSELERERLEIERQKLDIIKAKAGNDDDDSGGEDNFIEALMGKVPEVWGNGS